MIGRRRNTYKGSHHLIVTTIHYCRRDRVRLFDEQDNALQSIICYLNSETVWSLPRFLLSILTSVPISSGRYCFFGTSLSMILMSTSTARHIAPGRWLAMISRLLFIESGWSVLPLFLIQTLLAQFSTASSSEALDISFTSHIQVFSSHGQGSLSQYLAALTMTGWPSPRPQQPLTAAALPRGHHQVPA